MPRNPWNQDTLIDGIWIFLVLPEDSAESSASLEGGRPFPEHLGRPVRRGAQARGRRTVPGSLAGDRSSRRAPPLGRAGPARAQERPAELKGKLIKAGNDVYAVTILAGWCLALIGAANSVKGEELSHALLDGQLYFTSAHHLVAAACLLIAVAAGLP